jgi:WD40 repeat protein
MAVAEGRFYSSQGQAAANVIPLSAFAGDWQHSEIGELIRRYAPQVFDTTQTPGPSPAEVNALYQDVAKESQPKPWPVMAAFLGYTALLWACVLLGARMQTSDLKATLRGHTECIRGVAYAPDGKRLASVSDDKTIRVWDVEAKKEKWILREHPQGFGVTFRPDGAVLASSNHDQFVKILDVTSGKVVVTLNGPEDPVNSVAFSPDGKLLATCGRHVIEPSKSNPAVLLWDATHLTNEGKPLAQLATRFSAVSTPAFSPDSKQLAVGNLEGTVEIWDVTVQQLKATLANDGQYDSVESLLYSPDGRKFARLNRGGQIFLYETTAYQPVTKLWLSVRARSIDFSPDGKLLAVGCEDHKVRMVLVATLETVATFRGHNADVAAVAFSPDGKTLASAGGPILSGGAFGIYLWDTSKLTAGKAEAR